MTTMTKATGRHFLYDRRYDRAVTTMTVTVTGTLPFSSVT